MNFFKEYTGSGITFNNYEVVGNLIFIVGKSLSSGLLLKLDEQGSIIFSKTYSIRGEELNISDVEKNSSGNLIVTGSTSNNFYLFLINAANGEVIWSKRIQGFGTTLFPGYKRLIVLSTDEIIILNQAGGFVFLNKFSSSGSVIQSKRIGARTGREDIRGVQVNSDASAFVIYGNDQRFAVLDNAFNIIKSFRVGSTEDVQQIVFESPSVCYIIAGVGSNHQIAKVDITSLNNSYTVAAKRLTLQQPANTAYAHYQDSHIYFTVFDNSSGSPLPVVTKFDSSLNPLWTKALDSSLPSENQVSQFNHFFKLEKSMGIDLLFLYRNGIINSNTNLDTCLTILRTIPSVNFTLNFYDFTSELFNYNLFVSSASIIVANKTIGSKDICIFSSGLNLALSTITASESSINADGNSTSLITVDLIDENGNPYTIGNPTVIINTSAGTISPNPATGSNGVYTAILTSSTQVETATLSFSVDGTSSTNQTTVDFIVPPVVIDLNASTIVANPDVILADGIDRADVVVQLIDDSGNEITSGSHIINIDNGGIGTIEEEVYETPGRKRAKLRSSTNEETATLRFTVGGSFGNQTDTVTFDDPATNPIALSDDAIIQSPFTYLQAVGSDGTDSSIGRHLRWMFRGALGEKHLPKGNLATSTVNFNKTNDFVKIYRAPYIPQTVTLSLNFTFENPAVFDSSNYLWIIRKQGKEFYLRFLNQEHYDLVLTSVTPSQNPQTFLERYGGELLEIEVLSELFFAVTFNFSGVNTSSEYKVEALSVDENKITASRAVSFRKVLDHNDLSSNYKIICENGRAIRGRATDVAVASISFEFYNDTIPFVNGNGGWRLLGEYALSVDDQEVFERLDPANANVDGNWLRFNDNAYVNIQNYRDKWNNTPETGNRNIKQIVQQYINLSNNANNPSAVEAVPLGNDSNDPADVMSISHLDMLNTGANDFHIARALGLGTLDVAVPNDNDKYIYLLEYNTTEDLEGGNGIRDVQHIYMTLPTSIQDDRLPEPVRLREIVPGIFSQLASGGSANQLTAENGYSHNGLSRYVSIFSNEIEENAINSDFFESNKEIDLSAQTYSVYAGLEYKSPNESNWIKPEISNDINYLNKVAVGQTPHFETRFINLPSSGAPIYVHKQSSSGTHIYKAYGINLFSRAQDSSIELSIQTTIEPQLPLLPPSNINALLVQEERPLLLTSEEEQTRLAGITAVDKTLIRLSFNYHATQDVRTYDIPLDSPLDNTDLVNPANANNPDILFPDNQDSFADEVEIFFRGTIPNNIKGKVTSVLEHPTNEFLVQFETGSYTYASTGETISPSIENGSEDNYVGGILVLGSDQFAIHQVEQGVAGPIFTVFKKSISDGLLTDSGNIDATNLETPEINGEGLFFTIENMQSAQTWDTPNPHPLKVSIDEVSSIHREVFEFQNDDGSVDRKVEKSRGIWGSANISPVDEPIELDPQGNVLSSEHKGLYKFEFTNAQLNQHSQFVNDDVSVEWFRGNIRAMVSSPNTDGALEEARRILSVLRIENIGTSGLTVYAQDSAFTDEPDYNPIITGNDIETNFYPGYKVYLYSDQVANITESVILPAQDEGLRNTIFGLRSLDTNKSKNSRISIPSIMVAQEIVRPQRPQLPTGNTYATRPDYFGRSIYTLKTQFNHRPHGVLFFRSNDEAILNALYERSTVSAIRENLKLLGGLDEEWSNDRWQNILDFNKLEADGDFSVYPPDTSAENRYKFPNPDKQELFDWANSVRSNLNLPLLSGNPGDIQVGDPDFIVFVKGAIYNAFVPLTEVPIIYKFIKDGSYEPIDKNQTIRDRNGHLISPTDTTFDIAPMAKVVDTAPNEIAFTDFKLDGTSNNIYFYGAKEFGTKMDIGEFSPFLGPIRLVNTNPAETPEIKRVMPVLGNEVLGISPRIQIEVNSYPEIENISELKVYRTTERAKANSVRTMDIAQVTDVSTINFENEAVWKVYDDFGDLEEVPYGSPLFYRVIVSRAVEYSNSNDTIVDELVPSKASKIIGTIMVDNRLPISPSLRFGSTLPNSVNVIEDVTLYWNKTTYKAKYLVFKMNNNGNWYKIHTFSSNEDMIELNLLDTDLNSDSLSIKNDDGQDLYHHFKVLTENSAGVLSTEENILTIFNENNWTEL